jgi:hypothetical protein
VLTSNIESCRSKNYEEFRETGETEQILKEIELGQEFINKKIFV